MRVKDNRLKYILMLAGEVEDELFFSEVVNEELYDLIEDPGEQKELASRDDHRYRPVAARCPLFTGKGPGPYRPSDGARKSFWMKSSRSASRPGLYQLALIANKRHRV